MNGGRARHEVELGGGRPVPKIELHCFAMQCGWSLFLGYPNLGGVSLNFSPIILDRLVIDSRLQV